MRFSFSQAWRPSKRFNPSQNVKIRLNFRRASVPSIRAKDAYKNHWTKTFTFRYTSRYRFQVRPNRSLDNNSKNPKVNHLVVKIDRKGDNALRFIEPLHIHYHPHIRLYHFVWPEASILYSTTQHTLLYIIISVIVVTTAIQHDILTGIISIMDKAATQIARIPSHLCWLYIGGSLRFHGTFS